MASTSAAERLRSSGMLQASPFLKWAGGKGQLLAQLEPLLPARFGQYVEPFVGGGALFFRLRNLGRLAAGATLCDSNAELVSCYRILQDAEGVAALIQILKRHARQAANSDYYYRVRAWDRATDFLERWDPVERAARTLFLNHTCFNGLYRLNSKGQFNVPFGRWTRLPRIFDEGNLWACHGVLQGVALRSESFDACAEWVRAGDLVYFDPPYCPVSPTASFTTYTGAQFGAAQQARLARVYRQLAARGCLLMLSNSATDLIRSLYAGYRMETVMAARAINCKGSGRGKVEELVVLNY